LLSSVLKQKNNRPAKSSPINLKKEIKSTSMKAFVTIIANFEAVVAPKTKVKKNPKYYRQKWSN